MRGLATVWTLFVIEAHLLGGLAAALYLAESRGSVAPAPVASAADTPAVVPDATAVIEPAEERQKVELPAALAKPSAKPTPPRADPGAEDRPKAPEAVPIRVATADQDNAAIVAKPARLALVLLDTTDLPEMAQPLIKELGALLLLPRYEGALWQGKAVVVRPRGDVDWDLSGPPTHDPTNSFNSLNTPPHEILLRAFEAVDELRRESKRADLFAVVIWPTAMPFDPAKFEAGRAGPVPARLLLIPPGMPAAETAPLKQFLGAGNLQFFPETSLRGFANHLDYLIRNKIR